MPLPLPDPLIVIALLALGACVGFLAGLLGIGGAMLMVPFVTFVLGSQGVGAGLAVKMAIATSMSTILFTSVSSLHAHHKRGLVRWDLVRSIAPGIVLGSLVAGAGVFALLKGGALAVLFAVFVSFSATRMLREKKPAASRGMPGTLGQTGAGAFIGFVSGLVGAGGAFISVPYMTSRNVPIHHAVATSAALGFPIALASTVGYLIGGRALLPALPGAVGYLYLPAVLCIAAASVFTAPLGANAAHRLNTKQLRRIFAWTLYVLAAYMLYTGLLR